MREYTDDEMAILATAEKTFESAVFGQWYRNLDRRLGEQIWQIHHDAYEWNTRLNTNCAGCMLELVTAAGIKYYQQKNKKTAKVEVKEMAEAKVVKRTKVTTKKSRN